ncbi:MAG: efflux RND transporter permease subunit [Alphaproteobacteria bacterium]
MSILRYLTLHPTAANLLMLLALIIGITTIGDIQRATFPDLPLDEVQVRVAYPGASAGEVEDAICQRVEDAMDGISDLARMTCEARESVGTTVLELNPTTGSFDRFFTDIKAEIDAISDFPDDVEEPVVSQLGRTDLVTAIAVAGDLTDPDLKAYVEDVKRRLQRIDGISRVNVQGFSDRQIRIEIPADTLRQYGLSVSDIAATISRQSVDLPGGTLLTPSQDILIRFQDERRAPADFASLVVVAGRSGAEIRLGDIAVITDRFELDEEHIVFNGQPAALLEVTKTRAQDALDIVDKVSAFVEQENARAPEGIELTLTRNVSSIVRDRLNLLIENGVMGLILVFGVMYLFFSLRYSFWVAMGLPVSFAGAFFIMGLLGISFNMLSMIGLLVAVGLLMDDAIVIAENIAAARTRGLSPADAAVEGTRMILPGVLSSFATTVIIFLPLGFLQGDLGQILRDMPIVLVIVLSFSLIEAFFILPNHLYHAMQHPNRQSRFRKAFEERFIMVRDRIVVPAVASAVKARYLFLGAVLALMVISYGMPIAGVLKFRAFPELDGDNIVARILLPQGTPLERTEAVVAGLVASLQRTDEALRTREPGDLSLIDNVMVQYNTNAVAYETGAHVASVFVDLRTAETRRASAADVMNAWRTETGPVPDVLALSFRQLQVGPAGLPIDLELLGEDLDALKAASRDLQAWLSQYDGVYDLSDDLRPGKPEYRIHLSDGATSLGFDGETVARQLRAAFFGVTADEIQVGREAFEIDVRLAQEDRNSVEDLSVFTLTGPNGAQVPLQAIARIEEGRGIARIHRINRERAVTIEGEVDFTKNNADEILADTDARFMPDFLERHPTVRLNVEGQQAEASEALGSLQQIAIVGLFGVFLLLSFQFRSYQEPILVMSIIPLAFIGVVWGHLLMGIDLSMPSVMGFVSLAGVVVNNSILLVTFVKFHGTHGMAVGQAVVAAARDRFRPILLTTLTTVAGLLPILSETSLQAQILKPLVTSIAFGLIATASLVIFVIPAAYAVLEDFGLTTFSTLENGEADQPPAG